MASESPTVNLTVTYRGNAHALSVLPDATLAYLNDRLEELTSVRPENQKLIFKGKKNVPDSSTVLEAGLKDARKCNWWGLQQKSWATSSQRRTSTRGGNASSASGHSGHPQRYVRTSSTRPPDPLNVRA